jgi:type I restriction enzyme, S subunit
MIKGLKPYAEYKVSGQKWLGGVPAHWDLKPGTAAFAKRKEPNRGTKEKTVLSLSYGRIKVKATDKQHGLVPESYETYQVVNVGNVIVRGTDLQNDHTSLRIGLSHNRGIISSAYLCLEAQPAVTPDYAYQILNVFDLTKAIYRYGSGLRQNLDHGEIKRLPIFLPPLDEQVAIVRFLDHANRKIDGFIRTKRKLIGLLNEQRQAIIHRAVTCGLDPTVTLKPSSIPWLGEIPKHWEVLRAKYVFREMDERSNTGKEEQLSVSHITGVSPRSQKNITMFKAESYVGHKICRLGDLAVNTMWAWMAALGVSKYEGIISPAYAVYRQRKPDRLLAEYADNLLRIEPYKLNYLSRSTGVRASRLRLYPEEFFKIPIIIPPKDEQQRIVDTISFETAVLNTAIVRTEREIALMQEYRTRLTADIVTGKLDVREAAANLPAPAAEPVVAAPLEEIETEEDTE